jgi:chromate transporter
VVHSGWLHGLKVAAVAVVAQAIWGMAKTLCPDRTRVSLAVVAAALTLFWPGVGGQLAAIGAGAAFGWFALEAAASAGGAAHPIPVRRRTALLCLSLFGLLLFGLPLAAEFAATPAATLVDRFYRVGSLVFGGGHVVLPLLQGEVVDPGWIGPDLFLAGYGAAQAIPGPLVTFSAYLGAAMAFGPGGWAGGLLCLLAIFLPSFLLVIGVLPFWEQLRRMLPVRQALTGVNAAVVGLLLAAFYDPVWTRGILSPADFVLGLTAFALLAFWRLPPWLVVLLAGAGGAALGAVG